MKPYCWVLRQKDEHKKLRTYVSWDGPPSKAYQPVVLLSEAMTKPKFSIGDRVMFNREGQDGWGHIYKNRSEGDVVDVISCIDILIETDLFEIRYFFKTVDDYATESDIIGLVEIKEKP